MGTRGGARVGAGKKKGSLASHTITIQESKKKLVEMIRANQEPLFQALIDKALTKDVPALKEVFDRGFGKVVEQVDITTLGEQFNNGVVFYVPKKRTGDETAVVG